MSASFGDLVRRGREGAGLSQSRLATLVGRSATTIRAWEHGHTNPSDRQSVAALAAVLGLDENELLGHAGFEASEARAPVSARQELTSLATERTEMIALAAPDGQRAASSSRPHGPKHAFVSADISLPTAPAPEDEVVEMPLISPPIAAPEALAPEVTAAAVPAPPVSVPKAPVPKAPVAKVPVAKVPVPEVPVPEVPVPEVPVPEVPDQEVVGSEVPPAREGTAPETREMARAVENSPVAAKAKPRVVLTHRMAPGPTQAGSNGFVSGISYIEDETEKDFYRRRGAITAVVLALMVIVVWWAFGRTGSAIGDFFESLIGSLDI